MLTSGGLFFAQGGVNAFQDIPLARVSGNCSFHIDRQCGVEHSLTMQSQFLTAATTLLGSATLAQSLLSNDCPLKGLCQPTFAEVQKLLQEAPTICALSNAVALVDDLQSSPIELQSLLELYDQRLFALYRRHDIALPPLSVS